MGRNEPRICAAITNHDLETVRAVAGMVDFYEVRIDLIGEGWRKVAENLDKTWIACNRHPDEGGRWPGSEADRIDTLLSAMDAGAGIVDIELRTAGLVDILKKIKGRAECLVSHHDFQATPSPESLREIVRRQITAGADICKVVTTAQGFADNLAVLDLITDFPQVRLISFAMGAAGQISRVLSPLVGGYLTYASLATGSESAAGQPTVTELRTLYGRLADAGKEVRS